MPAVLGNLLVLAALLTAVALAVRSLWRAHGSGKACDGDCARCARCGTPDRR